MTCHTMKIIQVAAVLVALFVYVLVGGVVFHFCETSHENVVRENITSSIKQFLGEPILFIQSTVFSMQHETNSFIYFTAYPEQDP